MPGALERRGHGSRAGAPPPHQLSSWENERTGPVTGRDGHTDAEMHILAASTAIAARTANAPTLRADERDRLSTELGRAAHGYRDRRRCLGAAGRDRCRDLCG